MNNEIPSQLLKFREEIDQIDNKIIDLLEQRMKVVVKVGQYKKECKKSFFIYSAREADMIKNLVLKADQAIPKSTIVNIWRKIIASSNFLEQEIKIAIHNPSKLAEYFYQLKEYYGDFISIQNYDSITNIVSEIEKGQIHIAIFPLPSISSKDNLSEHWWISLAGNNKNLKIFAKIPFIEYHKDDEAKGLVAMAIKEVEKSSEDKTLLTIEVNSKTLPEEVLSSLKAAKLKGQIFKSARIKEVDNVTFYLVEIEGFFEASSPEIISLSKSLIRPYVKVLGNYPVPLKLYNPFLT